MISLNSLFSIRPQNTCEALIFWPIVLTIPIWLVGGTYLVGTFLGWGLFALNIYYFNKYLLSKIDLSQKVIFLSWFVSAFFLFLSLLVGSLNEGMGLYRIFKSSIGWGIGWALFPLYISSGLLAIRKEVFVRAVVINCIFILALIPFLIASQKIGLSPYLYSSPLNALSPRLEDEFLDITLYVIDKSTGVIKYRLFTPWTPALGIVANIYFWISLNEKNVKLKFFAILSTIVMCSLTASRAAVLGIVFIPIVVFFICSLRAVIVFSLLSLFTSIVVVFFDPIFIFLTTSAQYIKSMRSESSRVRSLLAEYGLIRWKEEAFWWGHGLPTEGPKLVKSMQIGSHNTWVALLYIKGLIGLISFVVPLALTFVYLLKRSLFDRSLISTCGLGMITVLCQYTISEDLEFLMYILWPGFVFLGLAIVDGSGLNEDQKLLVKP